MNKKQIVIIIFSILLGAGLFYLQYSINKEEYLKNKYLCYTDHDCVMSLTDNEDFQICVNSGYYITAEKVEYQYLHNKNTSCICKNNICIRSDKKY